MRDYYFLYWWQRVFWGLNGPESGKIYINCRLLVRVLSFCILCLLRLGDIPPSEIYLQTFTINFLYVHHQWSQELCKAGRYLEAVELLNQAASEMPDNAYFRRTVWGVYRRWAIALFEANKMDQAFDILGFMN